MPIRSTPRGATMPLALAAIAFMSITVAVAFRRVSSERRINSDQQAQVDAYAVAQSGLEMYPPTLIEMPPATSNATLAVNGGTAAVSLIRVRDTVNYLTPAIYLLSSRGTSSSVVGYDANTPPAQRTVASYMIWQFADMDVMAAFTSLSGLHKNGNSGSLNGNDGCAAKPAIPGVAVPNATFTGDNSPIDGNPDNTASFLGTAGTAGTAKDAVHVEWDRIVNNNLIPADVILPGGAWPTAAQMNSWPVIRSNGDLDLSGGATNSKGILIVTGNLTVGGSYEHEGIVLVGGTFTSNGNNQVHGAIITGLNIKLGMTVAQTAIANGNKTFQFNSCNISKALTQVGSLQSLGNAWTDNYPSY